MRAILHVSRAGPCWENLRNHEFSMKFDRVFLLFLVNIQKTMENHHAMGKSTISMAIFQFANC